MLSPKGSICRQVSCQGSHRCVNELCGYFEQFNKVNRVQFESKGSIVKCSTCGAERNLFLVRVPG